MAGHLLSLWDQDPGICLQQMCRICTAKGANHQDYCAWKSNHVTFFGFPTCDGTQPLHSGCCYTSFTLNKIPLTSGFLRQRDTISIHSPVEWLCRRLFGAGQGNLSAAARIGSDGNMISDSPLIGTLPVWIFRTSVHEIASRNSAYSFNRHVVLFIFRNLLYFSDN